MAGVGARDIKRKIKSVHSTKQITKAMELVSTAKLKRNKTVLEKTKPYYTKVLATVKSILANEKSLKHEYITQREVKNTLYIVVTGDRGLCGGYNINALKKAVHDMDDASKAKVITVGKKAHDFFKKNGLEPEAAYLHISEKPKFLDAQDMAKKALTLFAKESIDVIKLVYTRMESTISQVPEIIQLLPVDLSAAEAIEDQEFITYEPSPEAVLGYLIPKYIESTIYGGLVEASASEQAARRIAMESASDNAQEMIDSLTLSFNQARQAAITQEISEIVGGANALE
jgi:F-type H+-transporting ATPase subunit gamma